MKILAGRLKGHHFEQPTTRSVRPLSDKVRAALFDVVGSVEGFTVLDVYAGSGAAGFEAVSRGALLVEAVESNPRVARLIESNAARLDLGVQFILHRLSIETWLASPRQQPPVGRYGLIIADPPYAQLDADILERLSAYLTPTGVLALSHSSKLPSPSLAGLKLAQAKTYGDTALSFYQPVT